LFGLVHELERLAKCFDLKAIPIYSAIEQAGPITESNALETLFTELFGVPNVAGVAIGTARLTPQQARLISPGLWSEMGHVLSALTDARDTATIVRLLHVIMAVARETHDAASDIVAARQVASLLATSNTPQQALDMAESLLTLLPANHREHKGWRLSMAWLIYADVSLRMHNVHAGLRFLCFACLCLDETPQHARLFLELFRTAARAAREAKELSTAQQLLKLEGSLLEMFPTLKRRSHELEQMTLSIRLTKWTSSDGPEDALKIAREALNLLEQNEPDEEVAPLLSVAAQAAKLHAGVAGMVPDEIQDRIDHYVDRLPEPSRATILAVMGRHMSADFLRSLATRTIRASADWSVSLTPALVAARNALDQACVDEDAELFWTACLIICQPGLGVRVSERDNSDAHADPVAAAKWLGKQINAGTANPLDAVLVQRAMSNASSDGVGELLFEISMADFLKFIEPQETVVLLARGNANSAYRLELRQNGAGIPIKIPVEEWDSKRFNSWSLVYPAKYGQDLEVYFGTPCKPPVAEVLPTLAGLLPAGRLSGAVATVVVEGRLFNFAHRLASDLAGSPTSVAVCPSARWLGCIRQQAIPRDMVPVAWLGSPATADPAIKKLREILQPLLKRLNVKLSDAVTMPDLRQQQFVILGSHGGARDADGFTRLTDCQESYEPEQVAVALSGTACVVLFVCHGGRGDEGLFSHETSGLTSSLLRHGVRTVVASLWPLDISLAAAWLEEFWMTNSTDTIVERVDRAQQAMAKRPDSIAVTGEHPLVRCTFTVFGDGCLRVNIPSGRD